MIKRLQKETSRVGAWYLKKWNLLINQKWKRILDFLKKGYIYELA
jgi:hypothetical protein